MPECSVVETHTVAKDKMNATKLTINTHGTTHLDAPYHFFPAGRTVDQLDLSACIGSARVMDLTDKQGKVPVEAADLEQRAEIFKPGARVLLRFDWDRRYPKPEYFTDHPYLTLESCRWLAEHKVALLGMDSPTPNQTDWVEAHQTLLRAQIVIVEALANLDQLPLDREFLFMAAPLRLMGRDGAPIRALAIV